MTLPPEGWWTQPVHRIEETQFFIRPQILKGLRETTFDREARRAVGGHQTYLQLWKAQRGPEFFDMGTLVRLGSTVETLMRDYHRRCLGEEPGWSPDLGAGVFQRLMPWSKDNVIELYRRDLSYDLTANASLYRVTQLMLLRHLCAHASGLISERFLDDWLRLTSYDLRQEPLLSAHPAQAVYWFKPLEELSAFIGDARSFFAEFPVG
jgi:hypothetical protein